MVRFLPAALLALVLAGAWSREPQIPGRPAPPVRRIAAPPPVPVAPDPDRPRSPDEQLASLESLLLKSEELIDAHRAKIARLVLAQGEAHRLAVRLAERVLELEAQIDVMFPEFERAAALERY